jgi:hypothetical protein
MVHPLFFLYQGHNVYAHGTDLGAFSTGNAVFCVSGEPIGGEIDFLLDFASQDHPGRNPAKRVAKGMPPKDKGGYQNQGNHRKIDEIAIDGRNGYPVVSHVKGVYLANPPGCEKPKKDCQNPRNPDTVFDDICPRFCGFVLDFPCTSTKGPRWTEPTAEGSAEDDRGEK